MSIAIKTTLLVVIFDAASADEMRCAPSSTSRASKIRSDRWQVFKARMRFATTSKAAGGVPGFQAYTFLVTPTDASKSTSIVSSNLIGCVNRDIELHQAKSNQRPSPTASAISRQPSHEIAHHCAALYLPRLELKLSGWIEGGRCFRLPGSAASPRRFQRVRWTGIHSQHGKRPVAGSTAKSSS